LPGPDKAPLLFLTPEPSVVALSGIGFTALMFSRRKKQV
jgi:hypothetical protein